MPAIKRKREDDRSFAFENIPDPIIPSIFTVEVLDEQGNTVSDLELQIAIDGKSRLVRKTDANGAFKVPRPMSEIQLSLVK